ncbi:MAG: selenocysteine-specific translation elongation factor [Coriobacteriia bacterium]|nr:selenocysteine-specific translation elongation factor [Coriobacteriia bacterium]
MSTTGTGSLILGTAGHIDHGKSSLIMALTGTDPDRLKEEKKRGITIELGFAQLLLPSGRHMGVVDVPGHERFVRQMVQGATGVDVALLVIAADDGVMPQTIEHMAVLELLGVRTAVVALTKIDLMDEEWVEFMADEVAEKLSGTCFADAPVVPVSSRTGAGLDDLRAALDAAADAAERTKPEGSMRLPVDRVFTVKGFGTVITGTLWSGTVAVGDELEVLPSGLRTRVRSIQEHGVDQDVAYAGNRVALSLNGLTTDDVRPGDFLAAPETMVASDRFDANLTYQDPFHSGKPFKTGSRVHVAHGTREVTGRVLLMNGRETLEPGATDLVQIRLDEPLALSYQDRFILRSYSPVRVIAGGSVVMAHPRRRTNLSPEEEALLAALRDGRVQEAVDAHVALMELPELPAQVAEAVGLDAALVEPCLQEAIAGKRLAWLGSAGRYLVRPALVQKTLSAIERALMDFHSKNPEATGIAKEALRQRVNDKLPKDCFDALLEEAAAREQVVQNGGEVSHPKAGAGARALEQKTAQTLAALLADAAGAPPLFGELAAQAGASPDVARKALASLVADGRVVRVEQERYYDAAVIERYRKLIRGHLREHGSATAATLKDVLGTTRKFAMPLLEYFDEEGLTRRDGDERLLVE